MELTKNQFEVGSKIMDWLKTNIKNKRRKRFNYITLGGYAGTGKTTLINYLIDEIKEKKSYPLVSVAAYTGKAVSVLKDKGIDNAQTLHSLLYNAKQHKDGTYSFIPKPDLPCGILFVDESSMISTRLFDDLKAHKLLVVFVGDIGQLEPIGKNPRLMVDPDLRLIEIHRQAQNSPLIRLAEYVRHNNGMPPYLPDCNDKDELEVSYPEGVPDIKYVPWDSVSELSKRAGQVICGFNRTRVAVNRDIREAQGRDPDFPEPGDRVICLRNSFTKDRAQVFYNGQQAVVKSIEKRNKLFVTMIVKADGLDETKVRAPVPQFNKEKLDTAQYYGYNASHPLDKGDTLWDYAYCITCHKSQGSEADNVLVLEETCDLWDPKRWRYTAITRARSKLAYVRPISINL